MNKLEQIFKERPDMLNFEGNVIRICFNIKETEQPVSDSMLANKDKASKANEETEVVYSVCQVRIPQPIGYDTIVNAIISAAYPADKMQAIINNHLLESDNAEHEQEFAEMQEWRKTAKSVAKEAMAYYIERFN